MKREILAALACIFLISLCSSAQEAAGRELPPATPQQSSAPKSPAAQAARTPREEEELRADLLMARKQYAEAVPVYHKLLLSEPRNALLLNKLGIAFHQQTMLDQAKRYYERSIRADKNYAAAYNNLGAVLYDRKKFRQAIQQYKKAIAIDPGMATAHRNLGSAYLAQKKYEEAFAAYHRALELDPQVFENRGSFGTVLQHIGVDDKGMFYFFLAKSFASMGNVERCADYLRKARDEGYKNLAAAQVDPAFAGVLRDPSIQEILQSIPPAQEKPRPSAPAPPGALL
jgi:tetratricopeptide (TPR) repeat protein